MQKSPARCSRVKLVMIKPDPKKIVATTLVILMPYSLDNLTDIKPNATMQAIYKLPTKVMVRMLV